jgi:hypothetical protein
MTEPADGQGAHSVTLTLDEFGWDALRSEAASQGVSIEELILHASMYYLADARRGRMARRPLQFPRSETA